MSAVTKQEIVSLIEGIVESDACMGSISDKQVVMALEVVNRIKQHGIAPADNVKQADEETHRRVDKAVRNGRIEDRRAGGKAVSLSREEIVRMAKAFAWMREGQKETEDFIVDFFNAAYEAGAAAEREACAKVCDSASDYTPGNLLRAGAIWCAFNIRTRGNGDKK